MNLESAGMMGPLTTWAPWEQCLERVVTREDDAGAHRHSRRRDRKMFVGPVAAAESGAA